MSSYHSESFTDQPRGGGGGCGGCGKGGLIRPLADLNSIKDHPNTAQFRFNFHFQDPTWSRLELQPTLETL